MDQKKDNRDKKSRKFRLKMFDISKILLYRKENSDNGNDNSNDN